MRWDNAEEYKDIIKVSDGCEHGIGNIFKQVSGLFEQVGNHWNILETKMMFPYHEGYDRIRAW